MKAVKQIIDYLRERGVLTLDQLRTLVEGGFLRYEEVFSPEPADEDDEPIVDEPVNALETPPVRPRASKRGRDVIHKGAAPSAAEIGERLEALAEGWSSALDGLVTIASRLEPCEAWPEAAVAVRNAGDDDLRRAILEAIAARSPSLEQLWDAIDLESYRDVIDEPGAHGPAVTSYRAILADAEGAHLGRHSLMLRDERVCRVVNLQAAQRRLLRACRDAYDEAPDAFASPLRRDRSGLAYWAFVLLYSGRRGEPGHRPGPTVEERWPPREPPGGGIAGWLRAWAHAAAMDLDRVAPFLLEHDSRLADRPYRLVDWLRVAFDADSGFTGPQMVAILDRVGYPRVDAPAPGLDEDPDAMRFASLLAELRERVERDGVIGIPADAEATRIWETFVEAWLRLYAGSSQVTASVEWTMRDLARRSFGDVPDLYCPRTWDHRD